MCYECCGVNVVGVGVLYGMGEFWCDSWWLLWVVVGELVGDVVVLWIELCQCFYQCQYVEWFQQKGVLVKFVWQVIVCIVGEDQDVYVLCLEQFDECVVWFIFQFVVDQGDVGVV